MFGNWGGVLGYPQVEWSHHWADPQSPGQASSGQGVRWGVDTSPSGENDVWILQSSKTWRYDGVTPASGGDGTFWAAGHFSAGPNPLPGAGPLPENAPNAPLAQAIAHWNWTTGWSWMVDGAPPIRYMVNVTAMTVRANGQLIVAGVLDNNGTSKNGLHTFNGTSWSTLQELGLDNVVLTMACVLGYGGATDEHIHYGGDIMHQPPTVPPDDPPPSFRATYEWDFTGAAPIAHPFDTLDVDTGVVVTSIVQFESTDHVTKVWCARGRTCVDGPPGVTGVNLPDACWLDADGEWKHEELSTTYTTTKHLGGLLAVDYSTFSGSPPVRTPTLVFGYEDMCARGHEPIPATPDHYYEPVAPWNGPAMNPPTVLIRRSHDSDVWAQAGSVLRGNVRAIGCTQTAPGEFTFFAAGDRFAFNLPPGANPHDPNFYFRAGVFASGNNGAWVHGWGNMRDLLGPDPIPPNDPYDDGGLVYAFTRHGLSCATSDDAVFGGNFRGMRWASPSRPPNAPYEMRSSQIALYGYAYADWNRDNSVDFFDYDDFLTCFEGISCPEGFSADFNCDGSVDFFDYSDFVYWFEYNDNP
jgi:hypothetical protein